jgi:hypothetical protein
MANRGSSRTWVNDLVGGFAAGSVIDEQIDATAARRKKAKTDEVISREMTSKLFDVEDKGVIGNFMYNKFGIGDPPKVTNKPGAPPAAGTPGAAAPQANAAAQPAPMSEVRERVASGINLASQAGESADPVALLPMEELEVSPVARVPFAAPAPLIAGPAPRPTGVEPSPLSAEQRVMMHYGVKPTARARV